MFTALHVFTAAAAVAGQVPAATTPPMAMATHPAADPVPVANPAPVPPPGPAADCPPAVDCPPADCPPACPPLLARCRPLVAPRPRVVACPAPQVVYRTIPERRVVEAAPCPPAPACATGCKTADGFGAAPQRPATATVNVPYTYWVPVPTYAVVPQTGFGAVGFGGAAGFGGVPVGFGGVQQAGLVGGFGGAGFGSAPAAGNDAAVRAAAAALKAALARDGGFGGAGDADDKCQKELADLTARVDKLRAELAEMRATNQTVAEELGKAATARDVHLGLIRDLATSVGRIETKLDTDKLPKDKSLAAVVADLSARIKELEDKNKGGKTGGAEKKDGKSGG